MIVSYATLILTAMIAHTASSAVTSCLRTPLLKPSFAHPSSTSSPLGFAAKKPTTATTMMLRGGGDAKEYDSTDAQKYDRELTFLVHPRDGIMRLLPRTLVSTSWG